MTYSIIQAVTNNYDQVYDCCDNNACQRLLFTDRVYKVNGWEQHILTPTVNYPWDDIFKIRWNPFDYTNSDYVIWVDGSIRITGSLKKYIDAMIQGNYDFAILKHPYRTNIFDEYAEWIRIRNYPMTKAFCWMAFMEKSGWKPETPGLYQVGVCIFKNSPIVKEFAHHVWAMLHLFDKDHAERLDQTVATYVLKHIYGNYINVMPLSDKMYLADNALKYHGIHPNH